jgi:glutamyl-Q tRNA(Asp) synthetase
VNWPNVSSVTGTIDIGSTGYVGRFAPSPTGPLHFGSLLAAVASYLEARRQNGIWLVRIEDIDPPREQAGATQEILAALECYGFEWDGPIVYQSASDKQHHEAIDALFEKDLAYRCECSRKDLADVPRGPLGLIYPGTCRSGSDADETATRVRTSDEPVAFDDGLQGPQSLRLESESGDFVILRRDGLVAYQLAVALDDALQGVTEIVRGIDLMDSTPRQIWLQQCLGLDTPRYQHIPVAVHPDGNKLSKLTGAEGISKTAVEPVLIAALDALGQQPPLELKDAARAEIWAWADQHWQIDVLRGLTAISTDEQAMAQEKNPLR